MTRYEVIDHELYRLHVQYENARRRHDSGHDIVRMIQQVQALLAEPPAVTPTPRPRPRWFRRRDVP